MMHSRMSLALLPLLVVAWTVCAAPATEQNDYSNPNMTPTNNLPNPYSAKQLTALGNSPSWLSAFSTTHPGTSAADLDGDGQVGITDFLILLANWG